MKRKLLVTVLVLCVVISMISCKEKKTKVNTKFLSQTYQNMDWENGYSFKYPEWYEHYHMRDKLIISREEDRKNVYITCADYTDVGSFSSDPLDIDISKIKTPEDILTEMFELKNNYVHIYYVTHPMLNVETEVVETMKVDGCDAVKFKAIVEVEDYNDEKVTYNNAVGYAIMGSKRPIIIWAIDGSSDGVYGEDLEDIIGQVIETFKDDK